MTKEIILDNIIPDTSDNFDANYREEVLQSMDEYAKEVTIGFSKFIWENFNERSSYKPTWTDGKTDNEFGAESIFDLYLEHLKQQNNG